MSESTLQKPMIVSPDGIMMIGNRFPFSSPMDFKMLIVSETAALPSERIVWVTVRLKIKCRLLTGMECSMA